MSSGLKAFVRFRVPEREKFEWECIAQEHGMHLSEFVRERMQSSVVSRDKKRELRRILADLGSIGGNVNQLAHHANSTALSRGVADLPTAEKMAEILGVLRDCRELIKSALHPSEG